MPLSAGQKLAAYEIISALGAGGMGEVYRARDTRLGRDVAIKILPPDVTNEPGRLERFDREARAIAALNHPHIVTIFSTEEADGIRFLTMELVDGQTLSDLVVASGMAIPQFLDIAIPLADALAAAHQKQITHRDLKPGNVMVSSDGRVKVLDFGLARVGGGDFGEETLIATQAPITHHGTIVGTMPYMSPEQVEGRPLDPRSDLFSLGVIFYELLSGERPFKGSSSPALMSAIMRDTPAELMQKRAGLPEALDRLIGRLLEKRPEDRVQTARDVFNELRHIQKRADSGSAIPSSSAKTAAAPSDNLWIAVLPFTVRGADPDSEAMAASLTDDVSAGLAKFSGMAVVAAQSTRSFKDSPLDIRQIAERLGARYVIGGNVRKAGSGIRITAQLIDAQSGGQLWNETYDRSMTNGDPFTIQDDVTDRIVATVADQSGVLSRSMVRSVRRDVPWTEHTSHELLLRTWGLQHSPTPDEHAEVRTAIEARLVIEPDHADLWAELADLYLDEYIVGLNPLPDPLGRAMRAARRAIEINPNHQRGWNQLAATYFFAKDRAGLFDAAEHTLRINPRNAHSTAWIGNLYTHAGEYERGSALSERAMAINPNHAGWAYFGVFNRHFAAGEYEAALRAARRVNMSELSWTHLAIAAAAAHLDLLDEARRAIEKVLQLAPQLADSDTLREFVTRWFWQDEMVEALLDGIHKARSHTTADSGQRAAARPPSSTSGSPRSGSLTVAILPFVARSQDDESKALADGLTDDITSGLSRFGYLRVLSRSVAERLGREHREIHSQARYAIEGHVRKSGSQVRVGVTLVDTEAGSNLWTQSYDRDSSAGAFQVQDDVASSVVATIGDQTGVLVRAMAVWIAEKPLDQLTVAELLVRYHLYTENFDPKDHALLRDAFERRLEREPRAADGWACLAMLYEQEHGFHFNPLPDTLGRQRRAATRAIELDPHSQQAWIAMASMHGFARDREALKAAIERSVTINPLNADMVALAAVFLSLAGEHDRAATLARQAKSRKPQHPGWYTFPLFNMHFVRGEYEEALRENKAANMPRMPLAQLAAAAVSGHLGRVAEAKAAFAGLRAINPALTQPEAARGLWSLWLWNDEFIERLMAGFTKALALAGEPSSQAQPKPPSPTSGLAQSGALSVAVLPFVARSSDDESKSLAEGLTDDIIHGLSRFGYLRVLSRQAGSASARYTLSGQVRKVGTAWRVSATLADTESGANIWAEQFDRTGSATSLAVQDDVAGSIVATIGDYTGVLGRAAATALADRPVDQLSVAELVGRYQSYCDQFRPDEHARLRDGFERALALEPRSADGWAVLAFLYEQEHSQNLNPLPEPRTRQRRAAERAVGLDPGSQLAWAAMASTHLFARDREALRGAIDRVIAINPLNADLTAECALLLASAGQYDRAEALIRTALTLRSQPPGWYHFPLFNVHFARHEHEDALRAIKLINMPMARNAHFFAAATAGHLGLAAESRLALDALRAIDPQLLDPASARRASAVWMWDEAFLDHIEDGFRKALALANVYPSAVAKPPSSVSSLSDDRSIAVLPFTDLSEKKDQDWFCDGIAEEILNALAQLPGLRVAARASAFSFRGKSDDLKAIGEKLKVSTVLEGSVRRAGDRVRITTQLSDALEGRQLWSERFDRELKDIFDVQDEIARAIADRLRISIGGGSRLVEQVTTNLDAYVQLLKGREFVTRRGRAVVDAIPCFERALELDPNLAEAHALLADCYRLLGLYGIARASEVMPKAQASVERAMVIDPNQPEAMATTAIIASIYEWNLGEVRRRSDRVLAVDPNHVRALAERAISIACLEPAGADWHQEVVEHIARARALDPLNAWVVAIESTCQMLIGRVAESVLTAKSAVDLDDKNFTAHWMHVCTLSEAGREDEALEAAVPALAMSGRHPMILCNSAVIYSERAETGRAEAIFSELVERSKAGFIGNAALASAAASAGRWPEARAFLKQAMAEHDPFATFWKLYAWRSIWKDDECASIYRATSLFTSTQK